MARARSAITVVPPAEPVTVMIVADGQRPVILFVGPSGDDNYSGRVVRLTESTVLWFDDPIFTPYMVTCVTDQGEPVFSKVVTTGPSFNPAVATCAAPVLPAPEPEPEPELELDATPEPEVELPPARAPRKRKPKS